MRDHTLTYNDENFEQITAQELKEAIIERLASLVTGRVEIEDQTVSPVDIPGWRNEDYDYHSWRIPELDLSGGSFSSSFLELVSDIVHTLVIEIQKQKAQQQEVLKIIDELHRLIHKSR